MVNAGCDENFRSFANLANCLLISFSVLFISVDFVSGAVQSPPLITKQPPTGELLFQEKSREDENDKPFIIECEAEGEPAPQYKWIKNGNEFNWQAYDGRISQQQGRGTLVVTSPQTEDMGQYQCFAYNEFGIARTNSVFLRKEELNSFKKEEPQMNVAEEGKPFKLECSPPYGWPKPHVYWMLQKSQGTFQSINSSRITVDPEGDLWFSNVTRHDKSSEFLYACAAYSPFRNEYKVGNRVNLSVVPSTSSATRNKHWPVNQYFSQRNTVAIRGTTVSLWCIVGGTPVPQIYWSKKGGSLPYDKLEYDNYGKTLKIKDVDFTDEGAYDCDAANGVGRPLSYSTQLSVLSAPYFTVEPEFQIAAEGESVEFRCEASGKPAPEIKWIHNGKPLEEAEDNQRRKVLGNRILIENIKKMDTGNYGCNATNSVGYVYKDVYVNVLELPAEITEKPTDVVTTEGKTVSLRCRVFGAPRPLVRWLKNNQELADGRYKLLDNGDLHIRDVRFADAGKYLCDARNRFGNDTAGGTLVVKERIEQTKIVDKPEDSEVAAGTTATFRCSAMKDPTLTLYIDWLNGGELIDFEADTRFVKLHDNSLVIEKTTELDSGVYTCVARTEYDDATANATLVVQDVPNMPELLSVDCGRRVATTRWRPMGDNRSPILYYTIQYNNSFTPDTWDVAYRDIPATETDYTVSMSPWANYTFRVIARNKIGPSIPSHHSSVCFTSPDVPYKNPDNVKGHGSTPSNLIISWTPMPEIDHNAPKFKYVVQWKLDDYSSPWQLENITDWRISQLVIENQPSYRPYKIRVRAVNEMGEANRVATDVIGYSGMAEPTESPANFTLIEKLDSTTVHSIFSHNTDYNGPNSRVIEVMTEEGTPGPVQSFNAYPLCAGALQLVWSKPEQSNEILTGYRIFYQKVNGTTVGLLMEREPPIMDAEITDAKLTGLKAGTKYRIHIKATTSKGVGEDYYIERVMEFEGQTTSLNKPKGMHVANKIYNRLVSTGYPIGLGLNDAGNDGTR